MNDILLSSACCLCVKNVNYGCVLYLVANCSAASFVFSTNFAAVDNFPGVPTAVPREEHFYFLTVTSKIYVVYFGGLLLD